MLVHVRDGRAVRVQGDPEHPEDVVRRLHVQHVPGLHPLPRAVRRREDPVRRAPHHRDGHVDALQQRPRVDRLPVAVELPADAWRVEAGEGGPRRVIPGVDALTARGAAELAGYAELGAPWAGKGWTGEDGGSGA